MTNGDRIRRMTDEQFARFITTVAECCNRHMCKKCPLDESSEFCTECEIAEWLKQEVRDDARSKID